MGYASPSGRHTSSCAALSYFSGPLHKGHTRISSSADSTTPLHDLVSQRLIQLRRHGNNPYFPDIFRAFKNPAFYCIFLRNQDDVGLFLVKRAVFIVKMVWQGHFFECQPRRLEVGKETFRVTDAGCRQNGGRLVRCVFWQLSVTDPRVRAVAGHPAFLPYRRAMSCFHR